MKTLNRDLRSPALHALSLPIGLDAGSYPGARVLGENGLEYVSMRWPTPADPFVWTSAAQIAEDVAANIPRFAVPGTEVVVGPTGDFLEWDDAIADLLKFINNTTGDVQPAVVRLQAVYSPSMPLVYTGVDLSWIKVTGDLEWHEIDRTILTVPVPFEDAGWRALISVQNGAAPVFDIGFQFTGSAPSGATRTYGLHASGANVFSLDSRIVGRRPFGFRGTDEGYRFVSGSTARLSNPTVEDYAVKAINVAGSNLTLTAGSYRTSSGAATISSDRGGVINITTVGGQSDLRREAGVDHSNNIQVLGGGVISLRADTLGGTNIPVNAPRPEGMIYKDGASRLTFEGTIQPQSYTVATLPSVAAYVGAQVYVTDGAAGLPIMAFSDGANWLRCDTRAAVSSS